jgi:hypothetical protein
MKSKIERPYEKDKYFQKWLVGLSERTKENYTQEFDEWYNFVGMTPTQQIEKRLKDTASGNLEERQFFENKFRGFKEHLEKRGDLKPSAVRTLLTPVASFFSRNGLPLALKRGDWESTQTQQAVHRLKLSKEDVKSMYSHGSLRDRALLLVLGQSGFSEVDVSCMRIEPLKGLYEHPETEHYVIEKPREKTGEMQATCFSYEALHDIRAMLQERGNPKEGYLFTPTTYVAKGKDEPQLEVRSINDAMKNLAIKALGAEKGKEFKTKMLRSFYNSALLRANVQPQEIKDLMFGHGRKGARSHYDYDEATIKENYAKAFEFLSINGLQTRTDIAKLKEDLTKTKSDFWDKMSKSEAKNEELEKQVAEMQEGVSFLKKYIGLTDVVETPEDAQTLLDALEALRKKKMAEGKTAKFPSDEGVHESKVNEKGAIPSPLPKPSNPQKAVNKADYEGLAKEASGGVARAKSVPNVGNEGEKQPEGDGGLSVPIIDDKTFSKLVEDAEKPIPQYSKEWTDNNTPDVSLKIVGAKTYKVETSPDGESTVNFGDGEKGEKPNSGETVDSKYRAKRKNKPHRSHPKTERKQAS